MTINKACVKSKQNKEKRRRKLIMGQTPQKKYLVEESFHSCICILKQLAVSVSEILFTSSKDK